MKKFMKAIAFATVMCLVFSTAAFAAVEVKDYGTKAIKITVEGVQKDEQVAVIVTKDGRDFETKSNVLFVDQTAAGESTAVFETILDTDAETVDVYAGYVSNTGTQAVLVAENVELTEEVVSTITVTLVEASIVNDITTAGGKVADTDTKGALVYFKLNVADATAEDEISAMFWEFTVTDGEAEDKKYVAADATIVSALGSVLKGDVEIAAAFDSTGYEVTAAKAILNVNGVTVELADAE